MKDYKELIDSYSDYLTFYHECRIPMHPMFDIDENQDDAKALVVSSPSRMGNHLLMSLLDGHPELPSTCGEDGFHMFNFIQANFDINRWIKCIRNLDVAENLMDIASNGGGSKWREFDRIFKNKTSEKSRYSGVGVHEHSAVIDFEGLVFEVDFKGYRESLIDNSSEARCARTYNELLKVYLNALGKLSPIQNHSQYEYYIVHGGMRTQLLWLCQTMPHVKILSSIRSFESYAVSQIKSRHGNIRISKEHAQEAWEHWFHKVIDMLYLRLHFPDQFGLVSFDELIDEPREVTRNICGFLDVAPSDSMEKATIQGHSVKGNSWRSRSKESSGQLYKPQEKLDASLVPSEATIIWDLAKKVFL